MLFLMKLRILPKSIELDKLFLGIAVGVLLTTVLVVVVIYISMLEVQQSSEQTIIEVKTKLEQYTK